MSEVLPCLVRVGDNVKKYKVFKLDRKQITIGRSGEVTYAILSNMISRCHAMIKQQDDNSWTISDNKSLNGIYVNGRQLSPLTPYTLVEGDMVQLGVPTSVNVPAEFIYKFYPSLKVRTEKKVKRSRPDPPEKETLSFSESSECDEDRELKRQNKLAMRAEGNDSPRKQLQKQMEEEQARKEAEYKSRLEEMEKLLKEKEEEQQRVQQQLEREREEKEHQAKEVEELKMKEMAILMEMEDKEKQLEKEKEELRLKMQAELEASLKEREATLISQLNAQRESVLNEKKQIEESLQREMAKALEEKDKELEQNLLEQKEKLEKVLEKKDMEQKVLEAQLNETMEKSETHALKAKEEILSNFVDLMEMELQCSICSELFIKATSLNCSHTFCKLCINRWLKVKKECPNCRKPVTSQMQAIALDSYIDKMVEQLNEELKERRTELVAQRKVEQDKFDGLVPGPSGSASAATTPVATPPIAFVVRPVPGPAGTVPPPQPTRASTRATRGRHRARGAAGGARGAARGRGGAGRGAATTAATALDAPTAGPARQAETIVIDEPAAVDLTAQPLAPIPAVASNTESTVIELSDDFNEEVLGTEESTLTTSSEENNESDSDSVEGDEGAYYGGYGRCYNCGQRGHWANGCPF